MIDLHRLRRLGHFVGRDWFQIQLIAPAIDKGAPVSALDNQEVSRAYRSLADLLAQAPSAAEEGLDLVFQHDKDAKKKTSGRLLISPVRAEQ